MVHGSFRLKNSFVVSYFRGACCQGYPEVTSPPLTVVMSLQMTVEVERKFLFNPETLKTLEKIGGTC